MATATLANINEAAEAAVFTYEDEVTPTGHFGAVVKINGLRTVYLLEGVRNDGSAVVKGYIEIHQKQGIFEPQAYIGTHLYEGTYLGPVEDYAEAFAQMAN